MFVCQSLILAALQTNLDTNLEKIKKFYNQLRHIKVFLEGRGGDTSSPDSWIVHIRKVAVEVEDLVELYHLRKEEKQKYFISVLFHRSSISISSIGILSRRISKILDYINKLNNRIEYHRGVTTADDDIPVRECTPHGKEKFVVGLEADTTKLVNQLTGGQNLSCLHSVSIVGMGGIGKTTLAGKVYNDPAIIGNFACRLWISVTQHFDYQNLLVAILLMNSARPPPNNPQISTLEAMVHDLLRAKKFLAVLDDVWTQDDWNKVKSAFPDDINDMGSRLIITTRNHRLHIGTPAVCHLMESLNEQNSQKLFRQQACIEADNSEFEEIEEKLLRRCAGLPLAIIVVGRELKKERKREKWDTVYHQLSNLQGSLVQDITNVLSLSYDKLSSKQRSCFLRFGFFPENEGISSKSLIYLWVAEGLLSNSDHDNQGTETLEMMIKWGLIQAGAVSLDGTTVKRCEIHPLIHVLAASKARDEIFFQSETSSEIRHGAIFASSTSVAQFVNAPHLRSLLTFQLESNTNLLKSISRYSKLLKVLYLKGMNIRKLPHEIGFIWNLRYLNLCNTGIACLPSSVGNLVRLLILDVRKNPGLKGINIVKRLKNLQYLHLDDSLEPFRLGSVNNLRTLGWVQSRHLKRNDIVKMANLKVLKVIIGSDSIRFEEFLPALFELDQLVCLKLRMEHNLSSLPSSASGFCTMRNLRKLHLKFRMPESEIQSNIARSFYVVMEQLRTLPDLSISTLHSRCVQDNELVSPGGGVRPHVYVEVFS